MRIVENEEGLEAPLLRQSLRTWHGRRRDETPPPAGLASLDFCPETERHAILLLAEYDEAFLIEAAGDAARGLLRQSVEGVRVASLHPGTLAARLRRLLTRTAQSRRPIADRRIAPATSSDPGYEALALPFIGTTDRVDRLLLYLAPRSDQADRPTHLKPAPRRRRIDSR